MDNLLSVQKNDQRRVSERTLAVKRTQQQLDEKEEKGEIMRDS